MTVHAKYIGAMFNGKREETFFNVSRVKIQTLSTEAYGRLTRQAIKLEFSSVNNDRSFPERDGGWLPGVPTVKTWTGLAMPVSTRR